MNQLEHNLGQIVYKSNDLFYRVYMYQFML